MIIPILSAALLLSAPAFADQDASREILSAGPEPGPPAVPAGSQPQAPHPPQQPQPQAFRQDRPSPRGPADYDYMKPGSFRNPWRYLGEGGWKTGPKPWVVLPGGQRIDLPSDSDLLVAYTSAGNRYGNDNGNGGRSDDRGDNGLHRCGGNRGQGQGNYCDDDDGGILNPPEVPGPLPILGLAAAWRWSRALRLLAMGSRSDH